MNNKAKTHTAKGMRFSYYLSVVILSLFLGVYLVSVINDVFAFVKSDASTLLRVEEESSPFAVGRQLSKSGILRHGLVFGIYAREEKLVPGEYTVSAQMDYEDIVEVLTTPPPS